MEYSTLKTIASIIKTATGNRLVRFGGNLNERRRNLRFNSLSNRARDAYDRTSTVRDIRSKINENKND